MPQVFDTVIIGAGWAGAVAARDLARAGRSVLVLEARDRIGGRARTWANGDARIDLGCSWIHGYNEGNPARRIAKDLGVVSALSMVTLPRAVAILQRLLFQMAVVQTRWSQRGRHGVAAQSWFTRNTCP